MKNIRVMEAIKIVHDYCNDKIRICKPNVQDCVEILRNKRANWKSIDRESIIRQEVDKAIYQLIITVLKEFDESENFDDEYRMIMY